MTAKPLTQQISLTPDERKQLRELAYKFEMSMSEIIRLLVNEYYQKYQKYQKSITAEKEEAKNV